jgi:hypothetical protein
VVKPDQQTFLYTGYTPTVIISSGATQVSNPSGNTFIIYTNPTGVTTTLIGSGVTIVTNPSGNTWNVYTPAVAGPSGATGASGLTPTFIFVGSGSTIVGFNQSGQTYTINVYAPSGATGASGLTITGPSGATGASGLTVVGASGLTPTVLFLGSGTTIVSQSNTGSTYQITIFSPSGATGASGQTGASGLTVVGASGLTPTLFFNGSGSTIVTYSQSGQTYTINIFSPSGATGLSGATGASGLTITGASGLTPTLFFNGSGSTIVSVNQSGTTYTINIFSPSGATGLSGATGASGQTGASGLTVINYYTFIPSGGTVIGIGTGNTITIYSSTGGTGGFTGNTFTQSGATIITLSGDNVNIYSPTIDLTPYALESNLTGHTSDLTIHYKMSGISITEGQVINLVSDLAGKSGTGHSHTWAQITTKPSWLSGTTIGAFESGHVHSQYLTGITLVTWTNLTLKPSWLSGTTLSAFQLAHTHSQYLTGITAQSWASITSKPAWLSGTTLSAFVAQHNHTFASITSKPTTVSGYGITDAITGSTSAGGTYTQVAANSANKVVIKGLAVSGLVSITSGATYNTIVGNADSSKLASSIYSTYTGTTAPAAFASKTNFNTYTGTTAPATFASKTNFNTYTGTTAPAAFSPFTPTIVSLTGNTTLSSTHANKIVECDGTFTVTLPNSMATGMRVDIVNIGTGTITIAASTTLQSSGTKLVTQYTGASMYHRGSNVWIAMGKLTV